MEQQHTAESRAAPERPTVQIGYRNTWACQNVDRRNFGGWEGGRVETRVLSLSFLEHLVTSCVHSREQRSMSTAIYSWISLCWLMGSRGLSQTLPKPALLPGSTLLFQPRSAACKHAWLTDTCAQAGKGAVIHAWMWMHRHHTALVSLGDAATLRWRKSTGVGKHDVQTHVQPPPFWDIKAKCVRICPPQRLTGYIMLNYVI